MTTNFEYEKQKLRSRLEELVGMISEKDGTKKQWICPLCKSGSGSRGTSAFSIKENGEVSHCMKCGAGGDIFNLVAVIKGLDARNDFKEVVMMVYELLGEPVPGEYFYNKLRLGGNSNRIDQKTSVSKHKVGHSDQTSLEQEQQNVRMDYSRYINACINNLQASEVDTSIEAKKYLYGRGLNDETIKRFRLGHDAKSNEIIIPYNAKNSYYIARSITERKYRKPLTSDAGSEPIFNEEALYRDDKSPIFVTEG